MNVKSKCAPVSSAPKIYSRYDVPRKAGITFTDKTRTQQHFKNETDINMIISRAIQTNNQAIFTPPERQQFIDCSVYGGYQESLERLAQVEDDFYSLPSSVRKQFGNDVESYVAFMGNPMNAKKAVELGLLEGSGETQPVEPASEPKQPAAAPKPPVSEPPEAT
jgi:hypothetical protein